MYLSAAAQDPITGTWRFFDNSVRELRADGTGGLPGRPADTAWRRVSPPTAAEPVYQIVYGNGAARDQLTLRGRGSELWGMGRGNRPFLTARRQGNLPQPAKPAQPPPTTSPQVAPSPSGVKTNYQGMVLSPKWMPERLGTDTKFMAGLWYFGKRVVGEGKLGEEPAPGNIWGNLRWLMPLDEAVNSLGRVSKFPRTKMTNAAYPHESLVIQGLQGEFRDGGMRFNLCYLLADAKQQLVSVQFVAQTASRHGFDPNYPVENREPYFDFINEKRQGSTTTTVSFQVIPTAPGVKLIKTVNHKILGQWLEDVHWYLPAPLAGRFVEIGEKWLPDAFKK